MIRPAETGASQCHRQDRRGGFPHSPLCLWGGEGADYLHCSKYAMAAVEQERLESNEGWVMGGKVTALLIFRRLEPFSDIQAALEKLALTTKRVQTLADARRVLTKVNPPLLAFTESQLPDGNWADALSLSQQASSHVSMIVVGQEFDTKLYASAIEVGAFDFVAPPFDAHDLAHVVRCAADNAMARRKAAANSRPTDQKVLPLAVKGRRVPEPGIG